MDKSVMLAAIELYKIYWSVDKKVGLDALETLFSANKTNHEEVFEAIKGEIERGNRGASSGINPVNEVSHSAIVQAINILESDHDSSRIQLKEGELGLITSLKNKCVDGGDFPTERQFKWLKSIWSKYGDNSLELEVST